MVGLVYSFYIFDRHTECIYQKRWAPRSGTATSRGSSITNGDGPVARKGLSKEDDAKLVFGVVFSLRNLVRRLGGEDDTFVCYRTGEYKLHYFETPTRLKFVMLTDTAMRDLRVVLHQIWATLYVEYVVKNPLSPVEHPKGVGVANELFELGLEQFMTSIFAT